MHYYQFNIADWRKKTTHLTLVEKSIYRELIDTYYLAELPLELDLAKLMRSHCVRTQDEKEAFANVLDDFFIKTEHGYRHEACDERLQIIYKKSEKARKSAEARWAKWRKKQCENNANAQDINANACNTDANALKSDANDMLPINPIPTNPIPKPKPLSGKPNDDGKGKLSRHEIEDRTIDLLNKTGGKNYQHREASRKFIRARLSDGFTESDLAKVIKTKALDWLGTEHEKYYRPETLFGASKFESYLNDTGVSYAANRPSGNPETNGRKPTPAERVEIAKRARYGGEPAGGAPDLEAVVSVQ